MIENLVQSDPPLLAPTFLLQHYPNSVSTLHFSAFIKKRTSLSLPSHPQHAPEPGCARASSTRSNTNHLGRKSYHPTTIPPNQSAPNTIQVSASRPCCRLNRSRRQKERLGATPPGDPALQASPRTSRGPSHPKPFLSSSSRATSIASIAEVEQQDKQDARPRILFGTPFAGSAFQRRIVDYPSDRQVGQRHTDSSVSGLSPKQSYASLPVHRQEFQPNSSQSSVQSRRPHASLLQIYKPQPSQWSILLAPLSNNNNSSTNAEAQIHDETFLLPLQRSIEDQIECLKAHLSTSPNFNAKCRSDSDVDFYLDLSSVSALPASTMARLTLQSWKITFYRNFEGGATFDKHRDVSLPYLFRQTGLPIVALIRQARDLVKYGTEQKLPWRTENARTQKSSFLLPPNAILSSRQCSPLDQRCIDFNSFTNDTVSIASTNWIQRWRRQQAAILVSCYCTFSQRDRTRVDKADTGGRRTCLRLRPPRKYRLKLRRRA
ncbi:hypothetical protein NDA18_005686 [Ustilago nuda]|nr:hypothetical protein NDA18_005686 [Ustilago nuda]